VTLTFSIYHGYLFETSAKYATASKLFWPNSVIDVNSIVSVNEIVNLKRMVSVSPYLVAPAELVRPRFLIVGIGNTEGANALRALQTPSPALPIIQSSTYAQSYKRRFLFCYNVPITLPVQSTVNFNESANLDLIKSQNRDRHAEQLASAKLAQQHLDDYDDTCYETMAVEENSIDPDEEEYQNLLKCHNAICAQSRQGRVLPPASGAIGADIPNHDSQIPDQVIVPPKKKTWRKKLRAFVEKYL